MDFPNPHQNWWNYRNHYLHPCFRGFSTISVPPDIGEKCKMRDSHLLYRGGDGFKQPIILTCYQPGFQKSNLYGEKECYLHVYGVRRAVYLMFDNAENCWPKEWNYQTKREEMLKAFHMAGLYSVVDMKLVFKRPFKSACMGPRLFLKLYICGSFYKKKFKEILQNFQHPMMESVMVTDLHDSTLTPETRWFNSKRARMSGRLKTTNEITVVDEGKYFDAYAHHDDIIFDNMDDADRVIIADEIIKKVILPQVLLHKPSLPTQNIIYSDLKRIFNVKTKPVGKRWCEVKKNTIHALFCWLNRGNTAVDSHIKKYGGYLHNESVLVGGKSLSEALICSYYETRRIADESRAALKKFWMEEILSPRHEVREIRLQEIGVEISNTKRWLVFDIETDFVRFKPVDQADTILCISTVLFNHENPEALEYMLFFREPPGRKDVISGERVAELLRKQFPCGQYDHLTYGHNFHLSICHDERKLLDEFAEYCKKTQCSFVSYWNGHRFDLPFVVTRHAVTRTNNEDVRKRLERNSTPPFSYIYSFSYKPDEGRICYDLPKKKHIHKDFGRKKWAEHVQNTRDVWKKEHGAKGREVDQMEPDVDTDSNDEEDTHQPPHSCQGFLTAARKIRSILMNNVALVDAMWLVGDKNRGCKLDTAAKTYLNYGKFDDEAVHYDQIYETWLRGDANKLAAYAMIDVLLTKDLILNRKLNSFHAATSEIVGLSERELYLDEKVRIFVSNANRLGHCENMLTPDTTPTRDETYPWNPKCDWVTQRDYIHLRPSGGVTVPDVFGVYYTPCATLDFSSQYPSIMTGYNICMTSLIEHEDISRLGLVEDRDYRKITLTNVRPVFKHACILRQKCQSRPDNTGNPKQCKFVTETQLVHYNAYFVTKEYFKSILHRSSNNMGVARSKYKALKAAAEARGDSSAAGVYDSYQLAVKILNNSTFGSLMRISSICGEAITTTGRMQTIEVAKLAGERKMPILNGDTDSVFVQLVPSPNDCMDFGKMAKYYDMDPKATSSKDVILALFRSAKEIVTRVNGEDGKPPIFPKPCKLELEKIFLFLCNLAKKSYGGDKLTADLRVSAHRTGMVGKKADTTIIKSRAQFISLKLIRRQDFDGFFEFARVIFDFAFVEISHQENINSEIDKLCEEIPEDDLTCYQANKAREKIKKIMEEEEHRQSAGKYFLPLKWLTSKERVRDVENPKTLAAKKALNHCKMNGTHKSKAPMFVDICRPTSVQVTGVLLKILETLLKAPVPKEYIARYEKRFSSTSSSSTIGTENLTQTKLKAFYTPISNQCNRNHQETSMNDHKEKPVTKLDVTAMPEKWRAKPEARHVLSEKQYTTARNIKKYIEESTKSLSFEKTSGFSECPLIFLDENKTCRKKFQSRLYNYIEKFVDCDPYLPPYLFSPDFAVSRLEDLGERLVLPKPGCDIWHMYIHDLIKDGVQFVTVMSIESKIHLGFNHKPGLTPFGPEANSWQTDNVHCLEDGKGFILDMQEYRMQTRSTPYIVPSSDLSNVFLVNRDSFMCTKQNSFGFQVSVRKLLEVLEKIDKPKFSLGNVVGTRLISLNKTIHLEVEKLLRDDGRHTDCWAWSESPVQVDTQQIKKALDVLLNSPVKAFMASVVLKRDAKQLVISDEVCFTVVQLTVDSHELTINIKANKPVIPQKVPAKRRTGNMTQSSSCKRKKTTPQQSGPYITQYFSAN